MIQGKIEEIFKNYLKAVEQGSVKALLRVTELYFIRMSKSDVAAEYQAAYIEHGGQLASLENEEQEEPLEEADKGQEGSLEDEVQEESLEKLVEDLNNQKKELESVNKELKKPVSDQKANKLLLNKKQEIIENITKSINSIIELSVTQGDGSIFFQNDLLIIDIVNYYVAIPNIYAAAQILMESRTELSLSILASMLRAKKYHDILSNNENMYAIIKTQLKSLANNLFIVSKENFPTNNKVKAKVDDKLKIAKLCEALDIVLDPLPLIKNQIIEDNDWYNASVYLHNISNNVDSAKSIEYLKAILKRNAQDYMLKLWVDSQIARILQNDLLPTLQRSLIEKAFEKSNTDIVDKPVSASPSMSSTTNSSMPSLVASPSVTSLSSGPAASLSSGSVSSLSSGPVASLSSSTSSAASRSHLASSSVVIATLSSGSNGSHSTSLFSSTPSVAKHAEVKYVGKVADSEFDQETIEVCKAAKDEFNNEIFIVQYGYLQTQQEMIKLKSTAYDYIVEEIRFICTVADMKNKNKKYSKEFESLLGGDDPTIDKIIKLKSKSFDTAYDYAMTLAVQTCKLAAQTCKEVSEKLHTKKLQKELADTLERSHTVRELMNIYEKAEKLLKAAEAQQINTTTGLKLI